MASKAMSSTTDSQNQSALPHTRNERLYTLTPLGHQAVKWLINQELQAVKKLPLDDLPHIDIKKS